MCVCHHLGNPEKEEAGQLLWWPAEALASAVGQGGGAGGWRWILEDAVPKRCLGQREECGFLGLKKLQLNPPNQVALARTWRSADKKTSRWNSPKNPRNTHEKERTAIASPESRPDPSLPPPAPPTQGGDGARGGRTEANGQGTGRSAGSRTLHPHPLPACRQQRPLLTELPWKGA